MNGTDVLMKIADILPPENIVLDIEATSRRGLFDQCGVLFAKLYGLNPGQVANALYDRERLGSTGLGHGVALPHARLSGLTEAVAALIRTRMPIPFDAPDGKPVTDMIVLVVPGHATEQHLQLLADVARLFGTKSFRDELRASADAEAVHRLIIRHSST